MRFCFSCFSSWTVLFCGVFLGSLAPSAQVFAEIVVSTFEESRVFEVGGQQIATPSIANQTFEGQPYAGAPVPTNIRSGNVTFANAGLNEYGGWAGIGYSQKQALSAGEFWEESNDFVVNAGTGAGGSATWGVVYQDLFAASLPTLTADAGYIFDSLAITNTYWAWIGMDQGDPYQFAGPEFADGDFFTVRFTNSATNESLDFDLADFRSSDPLEHYILTDWTSVNLKDLEASQLNVSFFGSREHPDFGLQTPSYAAIDNVAVSSVAAVPEPSSLALMAAAGSAGGWFRWRRRRRASQPA